MNNHIAQAKPAGKEEPFILGKLLQQPPLLSVSLNFSKTRASSRKKYFSVLMLSFSSQTKTICILENAPLSPSFNHDKTRGLVHDARQMQLMHPQLRNWREELMILRAAKTAKEGVAKESIRKSRLEWETMKTISQMRPMQEKSAHV
jgi:hypothetical protein